MRILSVLLGLGVAGLAIRLLQQVSGATAAYHGLPMWDMAAHGLDGLRLADHLRSGDIVRLPGEILRMGMWPPVFPLIESMVFLVFGREYATAAAFVTVLLGMAVLTTYLVGTAMGGRRGSAAGVIAAALVATSPIAAAYGSVVMLEVPGLLLLLGCLTAYLHYGNVRSRAESRTDPVPRDPDSSVGSTQRTASEQTAVWRSATWVAGLTLALFLCKYNYGLLWIIALVGTEGDRALQRRSAAGGVARSSILRSALRTWLPSMVRGPARILLALYLLLIAIIAVSGGGVIHLGRLKVSVRSPANAVLGLLWVLALVTLVRPRHALRRWRELTARLDPLHRRLLSVTALPAFVWFLWPSHCKGFFNFVENRDSGLSLFSGAGLLFYPRAFLTDYSPSRSLGLAILAMGLLGAVLLWWREPRWRVLAVGLLTGLAITTLHRYKDPRFFFTVAPFVWLCAAVGSTTLIALAWTSLRRRFAPGTGRRLARLAPALETAAGLLFSAACLTWAVAAGIDPRDLAERHRRLSVSPIVRPVLDDVAREVLNSRGTVFAGGWNEFSPALVEWHLRIHRPGLPDTALPRSPKKILRSLEPVGLLDRIAADGRIERVILLEVEEGGPAWDPAYDTDNAWLPPVSEAISRDTRFRLESVRRYADSGYQLRVFAR